jgi:uncharacterized protein (DUF302 family)/CubicO group peptidase (beta-lactamase class C family)
MKSALPGLIAVTLAMNAFSARAQRGNPEIAFAGHTVDAMIADYMKEHDVPGLALAIVQAPYITRVEGYGLADRERRTLAASNTVFDIGQMRNAFTAVAILQLVEAGKLSLDAPPAGADAPLRELLRTPAKYPLLEQVVAAASGGTYEDFVRKGQFEPLGLRYTFFSGDLPAIPREDFAPGGHHGKFLHAPALINPTEPATGYRETSGRLDPLPPADHAIFSSAQDISIWDVGLAGDILVKDAGHRKLIYRPATQSDGTRVPTSGAWVFPGHEGLMVTTGSASGFSSLLSRFTKSDELVCVTLLANKEGLDLTQLARRIAGAYNAKLGPPLEVAAMRVQQSPYSVKETLDRLERVLRERGAGIVARVDHAAAAKSAGLELRPTETLIFGNPANGTPLMQSNPAIAVDLPLRAAAWEENGEVWLAATDPVELLASHGIKDRHAEAQRMRDGLDSALLQAVSPQ